MNQMYKFFCYLTLSTPTDGNSSVYKPLTISTIVFAVAPSSSCKKGIGLVGKANGIFRISPV